MFPPNDSIPNTPVKLSRIIPGSKQGYLGTEDSESLKEGKTYTS